MTGKRVVLIYYGIEQEIERPISAFTSLVEGAVEITEDLVREGVLETQPESVIITEKHGSFRHNPLTKQDNLCRESCLVFLDYYTSVHVEERDFSYKTYWDVEE